MLVLSLLALGGLCWVFVLPAALSRLLMGNPSFTKDAIDVSQLPERFGVQLTVAPLNWGSRVVGFRDLESSVLFRLPRTEAEAFLETNALSVGPSHHLRRSEDWMEEVRDVEGASTPIECSDLNGLEEKKSAAGTLLTREGVTCAVGAHTWFLLVSYEQ